MRNVKVTQFSIAVTIPRRSSDGNAIDHEYSFTLLCITLIITTRKRT